MWFEEGMAEYISRRYFLTDEEYAAEKETNRILSALYDEKFGRPKLNDFHAPLTDGILCIFFMLTGEVFLPLMPPRKIRRKCIEGV